MNHLLSYYNTIISHDKWQQLSQQLIKYMYNTILRHNDSLRHVFIYKDQRSTFTSTFWIDVCTSYSLHAQRRSHTRAHPGIPRPVPG